MPRRPFPRLIAALAAVLAIGCGVDTVEVTPLPCSAMVSLEPRSPHVISVGGSEQVRVRLKETASQRDAANCPQLSAEGFTWMIVDTSVARVDRETGPAVIITGLAIGRTSIHFGHNGGDPGYELIAIRQVQIVEP